MDFKSSPFSLYDLIGYFIPGASLLLLIAALSNVNGNSGLVDTFGQIDAIEKYLPFFLAAYVTGQLNALVSSFTVERYGISAYGYPSKSLLGLKHKGYWHSAGKAVGTILALMLVPISVLDWLVGRKMKVSNFISRPLDKYLEHTLRRRIYRLLRTFNYGDKITPHGDAGGSDFFRVVYHFAVENAPIHFPKMQNYVALFGFFRAFCMISIVAFWFELFYCIVDFSWGDLKLIGVFLFASYLFFLGFLKFYRRYSLEALMAASMCFERPKRYISKKGDPPVDIDGKE